MKKEVTFKTSWKHQLIMLSFLTFASSGLFAQNHGCNADFQHWQQFGSDTVNFYNAMNSASATYAWTFGDGGTSSAANPVYAYASPGTYYVCLTVTDSTFFGTCTDTHCDSVMVMGPPPPPTCNANFTWQSNFNGGICFDAAHNAFGSHYSWTFGDGGTSTQMDPCHAYASQGTYYVCLTVVDTNVSGNCTSTQCDSVTVGAPPPPVCNAHFNHYSFNGGVFFAPAPNAAGTYYSWTFGDGGTSTLRNPHYTYASPGTYWVCLTVADTNSSGNCTDSFCDSVHVGPNHVTHPHHYHCNAEFEAFTSSGSDTVSFHNAHNSPITTYSWDFGDGTTGNTANPVHVYPDTLVYYACLTVKDSDSTGVRCSATFCDSIHVGNHSHCFNHNRVASAGLNSPAAVLYPNPITETSTLHIENTSGIVTFRVFELNGRVAMTKELGNGDFQVDKNNLSAGMYFYDIVDGSNSVIKGKLIIQ